MKTLLNLTIFLRHLILVPLIKGSLAFTLAFGSVSASYFILSPTKHPIHAINAVIFLCVSCLLSYVLLRANRSNTHCGAHESILLLITIWIFLLGSYQIFHHELLLLSTAILFIAAAISSNGFTLLTVCIICLSLLFSDALSDFLVSYAPHTPHLETLLICATLLTFTGLLLFFKQKINKAFVYAKDMEEARDDFIHRLSQPLTILTLNLEKLEDPPKKPGAYARCREAMRSLQEIIKAKIE